MIPFSRQQDAKTIFHYLYERNPSNDEADIIIGFGHFDEKIPVQCALLFLEGKSRKILFTGGRGSGTADIPESEASFFLEVVEKRYPKISRDAVILEKKSTNTAENLRFSVEVLRDLPVPLLFGKNLRSAFIVANAYRQKRVWLTCVHLFPNVEFINSPPETTYEKEHALFKEKDLDYVQCLTGEVERIMQYGKRGFIKKVTIPEPVLCAYRSLARKDERASKTP
jgi:uncharacterized SAM-binding protein YcdF (DUF218 family)